jgi:hypothetical protein
MAIYNTYSREAVYHNRNGKQFFELYERKNGEAKGYSLSFPEESKILATMTVGNQTKNITFEGEEAKKIRELWDSSEKTHFLRPKKPYRYHYGPEQYEKALEEYKVASDKYSEAKRKAKESFQTLLSVLEAKFEQLPKIDDNPVQQPISSLNEEPA